MFRSFVLSLLVIGGAVFIASAQDKPAAAGKSETFKIKSTEAPSAATIDFRKELGLPFDSLLTLGGRIERARIDADPVGLAAAAQELTVAEKVGGKKASLSAEELTKEASELAKMRDSSQELAAVAMLLPTQAMNLDKLTKAAKLREADEAAKRKDGETPKGIHHALVVHNHSDVHVNVYVNGRLVGHVEEHGNGHFHVHVDGHVTLEARGPFGHRWHKHVHQDYDTYTFELTE